MAYSKFKATIWSKFIEQTLGKYTVFENDCNYRFKGEVGKGKTVKILGVTRPTIGDYTGAEIDDPEVFDGVEQELKIDQAKYFNFMIDDVDEAQSVEGVMEAFIEEASKAMAECRDSYIAQLIAEGVEEDMVSEYTLAGMDKTAVKAAIDKGIQKLWENGVSQKDDITIYLNPAMYLLFQEYITETKTDNDKAIETGILGNYAGAKVKMSNNFFKDEDGAEHLFIKTKKAVAFASGIDETEAYRPEHRFSDAIKGLNTYGGKVIRPREMYVIKVA
ncbi:MAG: hypothetical protein IKJ17_03885 [Clostridia bacterium]|nr:hypothetical protein [Clostridia bacterium]